MVKIKQNEFDPKKYMKLALEVMRESKTEKRADGKVSPKVGAVLVFPDGTMETAYRGEMRKENHAEYVLIERKLVDRNLEKAVLFSTLEPCVKRNPPKRGCCKHVVSARIKTVYVGIQDPDPTVAGDGISYMEEHGVNVKMFSPEFQKEIEKENSVFLQQAIGRAKIAKKENNVSVFKQGIPNVDISEFSPEALRKFIEEAKLKIKINSKEFERYLTTMGVMEYDGKAKIFRPTGMGILLFGKNPRLMYKQAALMAYVEHGSYKVEPVTFDQPLVLLPDLVEEWLKKALTASKDTSKFKRQDVSDFPIEVLREVIINAIVHRDYSIEGAKSSVIIDNEKIIVKSPGTPLPAITINELNTFKAPSISRNPIITYVFGLMNYVEEKGFGMKALRSMNDRFNLPSPEYMMESIFLTLTFPRAMEAVARVSHHASIEELNTEEILGYEWVKAKGEITKKEYAKHFGFDEKKALRHLSKMRTLALLGDNGEPNKSNNFKYVFKE